MTTRDIGISLREELDRREKLIAQLQTECDSIRTELIKELQRAANRFYREIETARRASLGCSLSLEALKARR